MNTSQNTLLTEDDPAPVTLHRGSGNILFTFPHNAIAVPKKLPPYLGMDKDWFESAHESHDLHMEDLYHLMIQKFPNANFIKGNYSRLVTDLNRHFDHTIWRFSSEDQNHTIPENIKNRCCIRQETRRLEEIYHPYHEQKKQLINDIRAQHGGIIVLDMHSFSSIWKGDPRTEELGTVRARKTELSKILERFFKSQNQYNFVSGKPYEVAKRSENAALYIEAECDLQYLGIEIRNDLIASQAGKEKFINFMQESMNHVLSLEHTDPQAFLRATETASNACPLPPKPSETIYDTWSV